MVVDQFTVKSPGSWTPALRAIIAGTFVVTGLSGSPGQADGVAPRPTTASEYVKAPLTETGFQLVESSADGIAMSEKTVSGEPLAVKPTALRIAQRRIAAFGRLPQNAFVEDRIKPTRDTIADARGVLEKIALEAPDQPLPMIDLDGDGVIVMSWHDKGRVGSLTVHGDGTYSYYVKRGTAVAKRGDAKVSSPLDGALARVLSI